MVLVPFLAYYFLRDKELISEALLRVPAHQPPEAVGLLLRLNRVTMAYIRGQLIIISAGTGALVALGLTLLGVKYAL